MRRGAPVRLAAAAGILALLLAPAVRAEPLVPRGDAEIVERLPSAGRPAARERLARRQLAQRPGDAALAVQVARAGLEQARRSGDPRFAGQALAALRPWPDAATAPPAVLLLQATLAQHLHDFEASAARLDVLLKRHPQDAQGWLTLAAVRRVQGRYGDADAACDGLAKARAEVHAAACKAEIAGLRGHFDAARADLQSLLSRAGVDGPTRSWLHATLAELAQRSGDASAAEAHWRAARRASGDAYAALGLADFLIERQRPGEARDALADQPPSDAVLLRRAMAGATDAARELRARFEQSTQRPDTVRTHGRELALFALHVDGDPARALALARINVQRQREPADLALLEEAARAAGDAAARREALALAAAQGLVDARWTVVVAGRSPA